MKSTDAARPGPTASAAHRGDGRTAIPVLNRWPRFARFVIFGAVNTLATYVLYVLCLSIVRYEAAYTISYAAGIALSYYLNARFVFREPLRWSRALQYPIVYAAQYFLGLGVMYVVVEIAGLSEYLAPIAVLLVSLPFTYVLSKFIITRPSLRAAVPETSPASRPL